MCLLALGLYGKLMLEWCKKLAFIVISVIFYQNKFILFALIVMRRHLKPQTVLFFIQICDGGFNGSLAMQLTISALLLAWTPIRPFSQSQHRQEKENLSNS